MQDSDSKIDITGLDRVEVVLALWNKARALRLQEMMHGVTEVNERDLRQDKVTYMTYAPGQTHVEYLCESLDRATEQFKQQSGRFVQSGARRLIKSHFKSEDFKRYGILPSQFDIYTMGLKFDKSGKIIDVATFDRFNGGEGTAASVIREMKIIAAAEQTVRSASKQLDEMDSWQERVETGRVPTSALATAL